MGLGGVFVGVKILEFYRIENVLNRFENLGLWFKNCIYCVFMLFKMLVIYNLIVFIF